MKKTLFIAGFACMTGMTLVGCGGSQKSADNVETQATELTEEIKAEAVELFKSVKLESDIMLPEMEVLPEGVRILPVKYFAPLSMADKAQTLEQKCALLGCYMIDAQYDKLVYGNRNDAEARRATIAKLITEANMSADNSLDSLADMNREDYIASIQNMTLGNFVKGLESNQADNHVTMLLYALVESTLNQEYLNEQRGEYDQQAMLESLKKGETAMAGMAKLITLLSPYYETLDTLVPVCDKIDAVLEAEGEEEKDLALMAYFGYIKELRGKLNAELED